MSACPSRSTARRVCVLILLIPLLATLWGCTSNESEPESAPPQETSPTSPEPGSREVAGAPVWRPVATIDTPRDDFADAVVDGEIWTMGGMTGERGTRLTTTEIYDPDTDRWRYGPSVPEGLASFDAEAVGEQIYVFGGFDRDFRSSDFAAVLDTRTGSWKDLPPLPHKRYAHTVTRVGDKIYVIGGDGVDGPVRRIDVFDTRTNTWTDGGTMAKARGSHDAVAVGGQIYVLGGWLDNAESDLVQVFDPRSQRWREAAAMPEPMSRGGAAAVDGKIYVSYHAFSAIYNVATRTWTDANALTFSRHGMGYLPIGDKIYSVGGCAESPLRDVDIVDVLDTDAGQ